MGEIDLEARNHRFFREITIYDFLCFRNTVQLYTQPEKSFLGLKGTKTGCSLIGTRVEPLLNSQNY